MKSSDKRGHYREVLAQLRRRKGVTEQDAQRLLARRSYFGVMMVHMGDADGLVAGLTKSYPESVRPALEIVGLAKGHARAAGVYLVIQGDRVLFFADAALNIRPSSEELADIAGLGASTARWFGFDPVVALLSYGNYGSTRGEGASRVPEPPTGRRSESTQTTDRLLWPSETSTFPLFRAVAPSSAKTEQSTG